MSATVDLARLGLLESVFAASPDMIMVTRLDSGTIVTVNDEFEARTGYSRDAVAGRTVAEIELWADQAKRDEFRDLLAQFGVARGFEASIRDQAGKELPCQISASMLTGYDGRTIVAILRDVSEAVQAREQLRKSAFLLERAEEMARIGSWEFDYPTRLVTGSPGARRIYGVDPEEMTVATIEGVPLPEYREALNGARDEHIKLGKPYDIEFKIRRRSDGAVLDIHSKAAWDGANKKLFGIIRDITEEKLAEAGLKRAIADRDALIRELYHRINNSLQTVLSLLALDEISDPDARMADAAPGLARRIGAIAAVHDSLYESSSLSRVKLGEFVPRIAGNLEKAYGPSGIELRMDVGDVELNIDAAVPCGIIVAELLDNAAKYARGPDGAAHIKLAAKRLGSGEAELIVSDGGPGLACGPDDPPTGTLGIRLATGIAEAQLKGSLRLLDGPGCSWALRFGDDHLADRV